MKKYYVTIYCLLLLTKGFTQKNDTLIVSMSTQITQSKDLKMVAPIRELNNKNLLSTIKGIPEGISNYTIFAFDMQVKQGIYQRFLSGELDSLTYFNYVNIYKIDESKLSKKISTNAYLSFLALKIIKR